MGHYALGTRPDLRLAQGRGSKRAEIRLLKFSEKEVGGVSNVDIDGNNTLLIKAIGAHISTFEALPITHVKHLRPVHEQSSQTPSP